MGNRRRKIVFLSRKWERSYLELVRAFPLASIKNDAHLRQAEAVIHRLLSAPLDDGQQTYLDALSDLVSAYEDAHHAIEPASDADMLRHLLDAKGVSQTELSRQTGLAKSSVSDVLAGRRPFSRQMIRRLAEHFDLDVGVLAANL